MTAKHTSLKTLTNCDNTPDLPAASVVSNDVLNGIAALPDGSPMVEPLAGTPGWRSFKFASPFIWNVVDNILIDLCYSSNTTNTKATLVWCTPQMTEFSSRYLLCASNTEDTCNDAGTCADASTTRFGMTLKCGTRQASSTCPEVLFDGVESSISTGVPSMVYTAFRCWQDRHTDRTNIVGGPDKDTEITFYDIRGRKGLTGTAGSTGINASSLEDGPYTIGIRDVVRHC